MIDKILEILRKRSSVLVLTCTILLTISKVNAQQLSENRIDSVVSKHMTLNHIPGMALAIIKNGKVEKKNYYGIADLESNIPIDSHSVFEIASMTKQIVCAGILLLQEDGLISEPSFDMERNYHCTINESYIRIKR
jgi:CubicO group peptidase (beta-lactamase class C family)